MNTAADMLFAAPGSRPDYLSEDLRALHADAGTLRIAAHPAWQIDIADGAATGRCTGADGDDPVSIGRALARAAWDAGLPGGRFGVVAGDDTARAGLQRWSLTD